MIDLLNSIDQQVFLFFNGLHNDFFDRFMMLFTGRFIWVPMYATILFMLFKTFKPKIVAVYLLAISLAVLLTDQTCATLIRPLVERLRPSNPANPFSELVYIVDGYRGGSFGFPSCHSANSFALAAFMLCLFPRHRCSIFIVGWAVLNSYSRLYLGVHYPGDLLVGAAIGSVYGLLCYKLARLFDHDSVAQTCERVSRPLFPLTGSNAVGTGRTAGLVFTVGDVLIGVGAMTIFVIFAIALAG